MPFFEVYHPDDLNFKARSQEANNALEAIGKVRCRYRIPDATPLMARLTSASDTATSLLALAGDVYELAMRAHVAHSYAQRRNRPVAAALLSAVYKSIVSAYIHITASAASVDQEATEMARNRNDRAVSPKEYKHRVTRKKQAS